MTQTAAPHLNTDPILDPRQAGQYINVPQKTLANWRCAGEGPAFFKIGNSVRYRQSGLDSFLAKCEAA